MNIHTVRHVAIERIKSRIESTIDDEENGGSIIFRRHFKLNNSNIEYCVLEVLVLEISSFSHSWSGVVETLDILWDVEQERIWSSDKVYWVDDSKTGLFVFNDYFDFVYWLNGSPPFLIRRFWASTVFFTRTVSAYVNLIDFGLTAKQPLFSTFIRRPNPFLLNIPKDIQRLNDTGLRVRKGTDF